MDNVTPWVEHLRNTLVLVGFTLFMIAGLIKGFKTEKLSGKATVGLFHKGLNFMLILGVLVVILGFVNSYLQIQADISAKNPHSEVTQSTSGGRSPAINASGDVNLNYGNSPLSQQKQVAPSSIHESPPANVQQQTQGEKSPAINSSGDVNVQY